MIVMIDKHQVRWARETVSTRLMMDKTRWALPFKILRIFSVLCSCPTSTI